MSEAVLEDAAAQVRLELVDDELGQATNLLGALAELRPVLLDQLVEQGLLWPTALVPVGPRASCRGAGHHGSTAPARSRRTLFSSTAEVARSRAVSVVDCGLGRYTDVRELTEDTDGVLDGAAPSVSMVGSQPLILDELDLDPDATLVKKTAPSLTQVVRLPAAGLSLALAFALAVLRADAVLPPLGAVALVGLAWRWPPSRCARACRAGEEAPPPTSRPAPAPADSSGPAGEVNSARTAGSRLTCSARVSAARR